MPAKLKNLKIVVELPARYPREIGRIVTHWGYAEWRLHQIAYRLLAVSPKVGRIAIREPKEPQYVDMIEELMELDSIPVPPPVAQVRSMLQNWGLWRNRVTHGIWVRHPTTKQLMVQATTGQWDRGKLDPGQTLSRKILPEAIPIDLAKLQEIDTNIKVMVVHLEKFWLYVDEAVTFREKSLGQSPNPDRPLDHVAQKHGRRRLSSPESPGGAGGRS